MKRYRNVGVMGSGAEWGVSVQNFSWEGEKFWRWMVAMVAQQYDVHLKMVKTVHFMFILSQKKK